MIRAYAMFLSVCACVAAPLNVREFGAKGDGATKDTAAIQRAVDTAEKDGGGTVYVPAGRYLSGTIHLKSRVTLHLDNGAVILASPDSGDFDAYETLPFQSVSDHETTYFHHGLITAEGVHDIAITGQGVIDGNRTKRGGPKTIAIKLCERVSIRGITVQNSPNYSISLWGTDYVDIDGVTILNGYSDGIDPDSSRYVWIANCYIDTYDDAICPKASPSMGMDRIRPVEHLTVTNCVLRSNCSHFKFGTESSGGFRDVTVNNVTMLPRDKGRRPLKGIAIESVDGADVDGVVISNVTMRGLETPIFIRLGNRGRGLKPPKPGSVQNISISNVISRGASMTSSITAVPGTAIRRVSLSQVVLGMEGGHMQPRDLDVPEHEAKYPEGHMFGELPAYGLYARRVDGLTLMNVQTFPEAADQRPAVVLDQVTDGFVEAFRGKKPEAGPLFWLNDTTDVAVSGAQAIGRDAVKLSGRAERVRVD